MKVFTPLKLMKWSIEGRTPQEQVARWNVYQRRLVKFTKLCCIGGYSENNVRALISGYHIVHQLNYPHGGSVGLVTMRQN